MTGEINVTLNLNSSDFSNFWGEEDLHLRFPMWAICVMTFSYAVVFILGLIGNCSVVLVVLRLSRLRTITNLFVCNLAIADFLVLVFCLVPNLLGNIFVEWVLGFYVCKTVPYIQGVSVCASVYSLVAISIERFVTIHQPFAPRLSTRQAIFIMISIWIWSCIVALPWALFFQTGTFDEEFPGLIFCVERWPDPYKNWSKYYFLVGNFLICYIFPLCIILLSYFLICWTVFHRRRQVLAQPSNDNHTASLEMLRRENATLVVVKTLLVIVFIFFMTWLPLYCINLRLKFASSGMSEFESNLIQNMYPVAQLFGHVGSAANPFVYGFRKKEFIHGLLAIIRSKPRPQYRQQERNVRLDFQMLPLSIMNRYFENG